MPRQVFSVEEMRRLLENGAQLVDVLEPEEFAHSHIPGAINIPLKELTASARARLDQTRPVIVYCNDFG
ncbi:MAG TPA: rhodanese-like domain-containing protein [Candidatus Dormibacteraeota bacterium]|jgi:rhodanese-related sulfurtransferase|nr:rhodanese-like domain-containing protein [Candidatus Dormibacteraeota bacterium]